MTTLAAHERAALADALAAAGPDAPTLCAGWTARDLAAHVVARETRPDSLPGIVAGGPFERWTTRVRDRVAHRPYEDLVGAIRGGPPRWSPFALPGVDAVANLSEHFVHCEDVRRAGAPVGPREPVPGLQDALWRILTTRGRMFFRASPVGVVLATPDGRRATAVGREPAVVLHGEPAELVLYAFGRTAVARVSVDGPAEAVERFRSTRLGV